MKTVDFLESIAASDLKVSRSSHLIEIMKVCEFKRSRSFLELGPKGQGHFLNLAQGRVHTKIKTRFPQKLLCSSEPNFVRKLSGTRK